MLTQLYGMVLRFLPFAFLAALFGGLVVLAEVRPVHALTLDEVISIIRESGLDAGLERVREEYRTSPAFREVCHRFMLDVGEKAYTELPGLETFAYTPLSATCNYGFFQAYPHALLLATRDVERARAYCLRIGTLLKEEVPSAQAECFRGIGRALPFIDANALGEAETMAARAVRTCDAIAPTEAVSSGLESDHELCVSGAFNMLGRATADRRYGLEVNPVKPFTLCEVLEDSEAKSRCYGNFKWSLLSVLDFSNPLETFETFSKTSDSPAALASVAWSIGYEYARSNLRFEDVNARVLNTCRALPEVLQIECVRGAAIAFAKHGSPSRQHEQVITFCREARSAGVDPAQCVYSQVIQYIKGFYPPERFESACNALRRNLGVGCELKNQTDSP